MYSKDIFLFAAGPPCFREAPNLVCAIDGGTYRNNCSRSFTDVLFLHNGECSKNMTRTICDALLSGRFSWQSVRVCGRNGKTYTSKCRATLAGMGDAKPGPCPSQGKQRYCPLGKFFRFCSGGFAFDEEVPSVGDEAALADECPHE